MLTFFLHRLHERQEGQWLQGKLEQGLKKIQLPLKICSHQGLELQSRRYLEKKVIIKKTDLIENAT